MAENQVKEPQKSELETPKKRLGSLPYGKGKLPNWSSRNSLWTWILFGVAVILLVSVYSKPDFATKEIGYSDFRAKIKSGEIKKVIISENTYKGFTEEAAKNSAVNSPKAISQPGAIAFYVTIPVTDPKLVELMDEKGVAYEQENVMLKNFFWHWILPFMFLMLIWRMLFARAFKMGPGAGIMSFGKNRAKLVSDDSKKTTFQDVAGVDEAKEEMCKREREREREGGREREEWTRRSRGGGGGRGGASKRGSEAMK